MEEKKVEIENLLHKFETLIYYVNNIEDCEKKILQELLDEQDYEELRDVNLSMVECHVIDCIERNELINTTGIAQKMTITKGGISKITAKLIKKEMIELQRLENNQKETYYTLTPLGKKVFRVHEILHEQAGKKFTTFFNTYSNGELTFANKLLADLITVFRATTEQKP